MRNLYVPVLNLNNLNFDTDLVIDVDTFKKMEVEQFYKTNSDIENYVKSKIIGGNQSHNTSFSVRDYITIDNTDNEQYMLMKASAVVTDKRGDEITDEFIRNAVYDRKPVIMIFDIKTDEYDYDVSSELRFWMRESDNILRDRYLPNDVKIKTLPKTHFLIEIETGNIKLSGCKLIEMYKEPNKAYKFAILVSECKFV